MASPPDVRIGGRAARRLRALLTEIARTDVVHQAIRGSATHLIGRVDRRMHPDDAAEVRFVLAMVAEDPRTLGPNGELGRVALAWRATLDARMGRR